jgi:hypothetical protein
MEFLEWLEEQSVNEYALSEQDWEYYKGLWEQNSHSSY